LQFVADAVGIIALVDEATGYQDYRTRDALAKILERFVVKEIQPYVRMFPAEFYKQIFRLNGWNYEENCGRPSVLGHWTNDIVYKRLAPGALDELRKLVPRDLKGRLKKKLFQGLHTRFRPSKIARASCGRNDALEIFAHLGSLQGSPRYRVSTVGQTDEIAFP
jgi:hypothetical protein